MRTFRNRLLVLIIGLVVAAQTVTLLAVLARTRTTVVERATDQLTAGASVARRLIEFRADQLSNAVGVLATDFGLREAVASGDIATIGSATENHARRVGADLVLVLDIDGVLVTSSHGERSLDPTLTRTLTRDTGEARFVTLGESVFQLLVAPVRAPEPIGWVALGFAVDQPLAREIRDLVSVDILFLSRADNAPQVFATSLPASQEILFAASARQILTTRSSQVTMAGDMEFMVVTEPLATSQEGLIMALVKPMAAVYAPYRDIRDTLAVIAGLAVLLAAFVGGLLGRGATRPIDQLVAGARRIERGNYGGVVTASGGEEFERLAGSFNAMQHGIAEREARIVHQAQTDAVTELPNRQRFEACFGELLIDVRDSRGYVVVLVEIVNLRHFSASLGFEFADQILREVGRLLISSSGHERLVAHVETGRFAVVVGDAAPDSVRTVAARVCAPLQAGVRVCDVDVRLLLCVGVALARDQLEAPAELLRHAEIALEHSLEQRTFSTVFHVEQDNLQRRRLQLSADMPAAIEAGELRLVYQPKVTIAEKRAKSAEVLARWTHPSLGAISPAEFVPLAERTGATRHLTRWVLREALQQLADWHSEDESIDLAVNLSAADIVDPELPDFLLAVLRSTGVPATSLVLEITESAIMNDLTAASRHMELLRVAGVRFSIDDFGTGHSSLAQLRQLPVNELKIDRSFVVGAVNDHDRETILRTIIELGHSMNLTVVAEGVETEEQWAMLDALRCDYAQGYLIARPMAAADFRRYLQATAQRLTNASSVTAEVRALRDSG